MTLKSGEWFYGAAGAREIRNIHKSVIESLGECSVMLDQTPFMSLHEEYIKSIQWFMTLNIELI